MRRLLLVTIMVGLLTTPVLANPTFSDGGASLQKVLDDITKLPNPGNSSIDVTTDALSDISDSYWAITGTGSASSTMIIELAGFASINTFGVYQGGKYVTLFTGSNVAGDQAVLSIKADGSVYVNLADTGVDFSGNCFGFYLDSTAGAGGGLFHSDTSLNGDGYDHMAAYQGLNIDTVQLPNLQPGLWTNNEYVLAWEDLWQTGYDADFDDFVVMVESVRPIPAPGAILLGGIGVMFVGYLRKRRTV